MNRDQVGGKAGTDKNREHDMKYGKMGGGTKGAEKLSLIARNISRHLQLCKIEQVDKFIPNLCDKKQRD